MADSSVGAACVAADLIGRTNSSKRDADQSGMFAQGSIGALYVGSMGARLALPQRLHVAPDSFFLGEMSRAEYRRARNVQNRSQPRNEAQDCCAPQRALAGASSLSNLSQHIMVSSAGRFNSTNQGTCRTGQKAVLCYSGRGNYSDNTGSLRNMLLCSYLLPYADTRRGGGWKWIEIQVFRKSRRTTWLLRKGAKALRNCPTSRTRLKFCLGAMSRVSLAEGISS